MSHSDSVKITYWNSGLQLLCHSRGLVVVLVLVDINQRCPAEAEDSRAPRAGFGAALMERCRVNSCVSRFSQFIDKKFDVVGGVIKI